MNPFGREEVGNEENHHFLAIGAKSRNEKWNKASCFGL